VQRKAPDIIFGFCVVLVVGWFVWEAARWPFHSRLFPWTIGLSVLVLALVQLGSSLRSADGGRREVDLTSAYLHEPQSADAAEPRGGAGALTICVWIGLFCGGIWLLGFRAGSLVLTFTFLKFAAGEDYKRCVGLALINYLFFLIVFDLALGVPLFEGVVAPWLGGEAPDKFLARKLITDWG
jgi:hypothetical protein